MELREIRTFVAVAQYGSFSRAAAHLGYSQAAVTIQMKQLEQKLGVVLFDRIGKGVHLTTSGQRFYPHAIRILNDLSLAQEDLQAESQLTGSLKIGTINSLCAAVLPQLLERYHSRCPLVRLSVVTDTPQPGSKSCQTDYRILSSANGLSLVECKLITGRTHQIRAQFAHAGHPLLGDGKYGKLDKRFDRNYQALYSYRLRFDFTTDAGSLGYLNGGAGGLRSGVFPWIPVIRRNFS